MYLPCADVDVAFWARVRTCVRAFVRVTLTHVAQVAVHYDRSRVLRGVRDLLLPALSRGDARRRRARCQQVLRQATLATRARTFLRVGVTCGVVFFGLLLKRALPPCGIVNASDINGSCTA